LFLLAVEPFLDDADFGVQGFFVGVFSFQLPPPILVLRVLQLPGEFVFLEMDFLDFPLQLEHLICVLGHIAQPFLRNLDLALVLSNLYLDHPDLVLHAFDVHFGCPQDVLLDVGLLVEDAELVVSVDQLNASQIPVFAGQLILLPKPLHILLERDDDHVEFFYFVGVLVDELLLLLLL